MTNIMRPFHALPVALILLLFSGGVVLAETETQITTAEFRSTGEGAGSLQFSMVASLVPNSPGYSHGNGTASIRIEGTTLAVHLHAWQMASNTHFMLVVTANGVSHSVANITSGDDGEVEAEGTISLSPGSYSLGLQVLDMSSFSVPTLVLASNPATQAATISQSSTTYTQTGEGGQNVSPVQGSETEDESIRTALQTKFIPAVVEVGDSSSSTYVTDSNFSISVGRFQQAGYVISLSADNVTGPRVLLVNLTSNSARTLLTNSVAVTLDGAGVPQAVSLAQVLGARAGDPPHFILISTATGVKMLISIPHFSSHIIEIFPILGEIGAALLVDLPALVISVAAVSAFVLAIYVRRTRALV